MLLFGSCLPIRAFSPKNHGSFIPRFAEAAIGATLFGGQYLLSEEDSTVRGSIAAFGGLLIGLALLAGKQSPARKRRDADVMDRSDP